MGVELVSLVKETFPSGKKVNLVWESLVSFTWLIPKMSKGLFRYLFRIPHPPTPSAAEKTLKCCVEYDSASNTLTLPGGLSVFRI